MTDPIRTFIADETGAVTVDWVVLTAAIVGLGIAVIATINDGVDNVGSGVATSFNDIVAALHEAFETDLQTEYFENPYPFYQDYTCADLSETAAGLDWRPKRTPHEAIFKYARGLRAAGEA